MKTLKTIFLSVIILCFCSIGVIAEGDTVASTEATIIPSMSYVDSTGAVQTATSVTQISNDTKLTFGTDASPSWYWAGGNNDTGTKATTVTATNVTLGSAEDSPNTGTINIIVGPNGGENSVAMQIQTSGWTLSQGQKINIFAAASGNPNEVPLSDCFVELLNTTGTSGNALTMSGGTLAINSGAFDLTGNQAVGLELSGGNVTISSKGQLQSTYNNTNNTAQTKADSPDAQQNGLSISGTGSITNSGYLRVIQNFNPGQASGTGWDYALINNTTTNGTGLVVNDGTVETSSVKPDNLTSGIWIQHYKENSTFILNSYGDVTLNRGVYDAATFSGNNTFTVNNGNLTIPNGFTLTFGTETSTGTPDGTLSVQGTLIIKPEAQVTMNANSILQNNGTIEVEQPTPSTNS